MKQDLTWALESVLSATPARAAVLLVHDNSNNRWIPHALAGVVPYEESLRWTIPTATIRSTPVLDRFLSGKVKESYLPTLQALPGKVEFTYLPPNAQEALLLPVQSGENDEKRVVLVLGSDTAK
eukprot:10207333-Ditylum_brightwellii.AAC.1